jgi:probable HAF family extracellular repeat protein
MPVNLIRNPRPWRVALAACVALSPCSMLVGQQYSILDLGSLGGPASGAFGINAGGLTVGVAATAQANFHAFRWDGSMHDLPPLFGDTQSVAFAIDALGNPVGMSYVMGELAPHAVRWQGSVPSFIDSFAPRSVGDTGVIVGYSSTTITGRGWVDRACVLRNATLSILPGLGGSNSYANDVDASGRIVGTSFQTDDMTRRACLWLNDQPLDLGTLGGASSQAYAINNAGQVVGLSNTSTGQAHAFLFVVNSSGQVITRTDLGELGGGHSVAYALNDRGEAVGTSNSQAFYWYNGQLVDLSMRIPAGTGWTLSSASAISDNGQIAGTGFVLGQPHAFLLAPVAPDFDHDNDVDQRDFAHFQACYTGPAKPQINAACWDALLDGDTFVDRNDFLLFQGCVSGPGVPASPACWRQ